MKTATALSVAVVACMLAEVCFSDNCSQAGQPQAFITGTSLSHCQVLAYRDKLRRLSQQGNWIHVNQLPEVHRYPPDAKYTWNSMVCDVEYQKRLGNDSSLPPYRPGLYYDWVSDPPLEPWNLTAFCRNLHGKKILIVGDSLNHQLYESMVNHGTSTPPADQWEGSVKSKERVLCGGTPYKVAVSFQRNDRLHLNTNTSVSKDYYEYPWAQDAPRYDILILNRGAHYENDTAYLHALSQLWRLFASSPRLVFYRSTPYGHVGCEKYETPGAVPNATEMPWHWAQFETQNMLAQAVIEGQGMVYLDFAALSKDRRDQHRGSGDCLHYCAPGPVDYWLLMFHTAMTWLTEVQEIARRR